MSSRSLRPALASIALLAVGLSVLGGASAAPGDPALGLGAQTSGEPCEPQPGPVSQAAAWARCQTYEVVESTKEWACEVARC